MTLPALLIEEEDGDEERIDSFYGVVLRVFGGISRECNAEIFEAPDLAGAPDVANAALIVTVSRPDPSGTNVIIEKDNTAVQSWYRARSALDFGWTVSAFTNWRPATPKLIQFPLPEFPDVTVAPTSVVVTSGIDAERALVTWTKAVDGFVAFYEVQARRTDGDNVYRVLKELNKEDNVAWITGVRQGQSWQARVRAINIGGVPSAFVTSAVHVIQVHAFADPTYGTPLASAAGIIYPVTFDVNTARIRVYSRENVASGAADPEEKIQYDAGELVPGELTITIDTTSQFFRRTRLVAFNAFGERGTDSGITETQALDSGVGPTGPPTTIAISGQTASGYTVTVTRGDSDAATYIYEDGQHIGIVDASPAANTLVVTGRAPSTTFQVDGRHFRNGQFSTFHGEVAAVTLAGTVDAPVLSFVTDGPGTPGAAGVGIGWVAPINVPDCTFRIERDDTGGGGFPFLVGTPGSGQTYLNHIDQAESGNNRFFRVIGLKTGWTDSVPSNVRDGTYLEGEEEF